MVRIVGLRAWVVIYLKGLCMGAADTVPGVSGGTIALILGVYERLITALTSITIGPIRHLPRLHRRERRIALASELQAMDVPFLLVLGSGVLSAAVTVASAMNVAVTTRPVPTYAFFFGLIAASAVVLYRHVDLASPERIVVAIVGVVVAFVVTGITAESGTDPTPLVVFGAGAIAITAMVLPGISGAFLLLVLGQYEYVSGIPRRIAEATLGTLQGGDPAGLWSALVPFASFAVGALVGLFTIAYVVRAALATYRKATLVFLVSLMVGALRYPGNAIVENADGPSPETVLVVVASFVLGVAAILVLDRYTDDLEY